MKKALLLLILAIPDPAAHAAVLNIRGTTSCAVQEFLESQPGTVSSDDQEGDPRAGTGGIGSTADVETVELDGLLIGHARATSSIGDPAPLIVPNPEELSLEAGCFSNADSVSYLVTTSVEETRTIVLKRSEIPANGRVESLLTLCGAIVVWATDSNIPLDSIEGSVEATITSADGEAYLESTINLALPSQSGIEVVGALRVEDVTTDDLAALGVDEDSLNILERVQESGRLLMFALPQQRHRYRYPASANTNFELTASLRVRLRNAPGGTGIAVALGRPFAELAEFIGAGLPGVDGQKLQKAINDAVAERSKDQAPQTGGFTRPCGVMGLEAALLLLPLAFFHACAGRSLRPD